MPTFQTTLEIPVEVEYRTTSAEPASRDRWGAPEEPGLAPVSELLAIAATSPALAGRGPAWRRCAPMRPGWYWLRRPGAEPTIRRLVEIPVHTSAEATAVRASLSAEASHRLESDDHPGADLGPGRKDSGSFTMEETFAPSATVTAMATPARPPAPRPAANLSTILIMLEPGESPRSSRHLPATACPSNWQWAGPIPLPGAALAVAIAPECLEAADHRRLVSEIPAQ